MNMRRMLAVLGLYLLCLLAGIFAGMLLGVAVGSYTGSMQYESPFAYKGLMYGCYLYVPFLVLTLVTAAFHQLPGRGLLAGLAYLALCVYLFTLKLWPARGMEMESRVDYALVLFVPAAFILLLGYLVARKAKHFDAGGKLAHAAAASARLPQRLIRRHPKMLLCIAVLYVFTWIGGWQTYVRDMQTMADRDYVHYVQWEQRNNERRAQAGMASLTPNPRTDGPHPFVQWCVPILPGVLVAKSGFTGTGREDDGVRTFYENGGIRIVLYWVVRTSEVLPLSQYFADGVLSEAAQE